MVTKRSAIKMIKEYVAACNKKNIYFDKVIFFGSVVNGQATENSDIDLALVSDQFSGNSINDWQMLGPVNIRFSMIEPHTFDRNYFMKGDPFINEIKRTGIEIN